MTSFTTGMAAVQDALAKAEKRAESTQSWGAGQSLTYINWAVGEKKIVRFLADGILTEKFYRFIIDKNGNPKNFMVNPADPNCLQRYMSPVPGIGWCRDYATKQLKQPTPVEMTAGIAVLREEKPGPNGRLVIQDCLHDREIKDVTYRSRTFGVVQQLQSNFWRTLAYSCYKRYGTICDRDYEITRLDVNPVRYEIIPLEPVPELNSVEAVQQHYFYGYEWDENDPDRFLKCPQTILQWGEYFSSDDRYRHWLVPDNQKGSVPQPAQEQQKYTPSGVDEFAKETTHNSADEAQASPPSGTRFSTLRESLGISNSDKK